jgi:hypothetical protein
MHQHHPLFIEPYLTGLEGKAKAGGNLCNARGALFPPVKAYGIFHDKDAYYF